MFSRSNTISGVSYRTQIIRYSISVAGFQTETCVPPRGKQCMHIRKCPYFDYLLNHTTKPRPMSLIKLIQENQCGFDGNNPYVCCDDLPSSSSSITTTTTTLAPVYNKLGDAVHKHPNFNLLPIDICGTSVPFSTDSRITAGTQTVIEEYPWMALLAYYKDKEVDFRCGGTVINERYVLTAAHCIIRSSVFGVRLGEHNLDEKIDCTPNGDYCAPRPQDFYIESTVVHPEYDPKTFINDIALIRLATPANFSASNVKPICLPIEKVDLTGSHGIIAGWGVTETGQKSSELLKVSLPVLPISVCQTIYKKFARITDDQICAGRGDGKDSCGGDSGGPMQYVGTVVDGTPRFMQYGIVSYGPRHCGMNGNPSIYTRVGNYLEWILDNMERDNLIYVWIIKYIYRIGGSSSTPQVIVEAKETIPI
ncbi:hypothetical protein NQ317_010712 [Molorchus minor]|uniref:CLIP domain-containing serine protease n=1 Tax=Molorchus minor TaxID=1323400 RepID=A0ABQ9K6L5_9CUCU|nr:hypothetical protein NQ317_010712 [Molorchus minor]